MKATKKLAALFLALAMTLSLCVCVSASDLTALPSAAQTSSGSVSKENSPTTTVYKLTFPTASANTFDFILDPENLIRNTHAAAYNQAAFSDVAGHLFFKNTASSENGGTVTSYSGSSDSVTVTNKSSVPVNVTLTTSLTGLSADTYTFSATDDLSSAEGPAIYLAMKSKCVDTANAAWDYTLPEVNYVKDDYIGIFNTVAFAWDDGITGVLGDDDSTAEDIAAANALKNAFNTALAEGLKIEIDYVHLAEDDGDDETDETVMTATPKAVTLTGYTLTFDSDDGYLLDSTSDDKTLTATLTVTTGEGDNATAIGAFTFNFKDDLTASTTTLEDATVSVSVAAGSQVINEATPVASGDSGVKAEVTRLLPGVPNAYEIGYNATDKVYTYAEKEGHNIPYKSIAFNLTGKINDDAGWSALSGTPTIAVTWNMTAVDAGDGDGDGNDDVQVTPPALTVDTAITSATGNGKWTIQVNDSGMTKVASTKVVSTSNVTKTLTPTVVTTATYTAAKASYTYNADEGTITVYVKANSSSAPQASYKNTTIVLANADGSTQYTLTFDATATGGPTDFTAVE